MPLLTFLKPTPDRILGLDISSTSVKLLELSQLSSGYHVEGYAVIPFPPNAVINKEIKDSSAVAETIQRAVKRLGTASRKVALAVPDASVITRIISLDKALNPKDMEVQVALEAEKHIAYPITELSLDFEVLNVNAKQPEFVDVLLVASHTKHVEARVDVVADSGLEAVIVDVESQAMTRALCSLVLPQISDYQPEHNFAVVDIGATNTTLTVIRKGDVIFNRTESFGGQTLTQQIQERYKLSYAEAGLLKKLNQLPPDYLRELLQPFQETAVLQIRRALQFFFATQQAGDIKHIILSGGSAMLLGLAAFIAEQISIPVTIANPFARMTFTPSILSDVLLKDAPSLMTCCGLAMRSPDSWYR